MSHSQFHSTKLFILRPFPPGTRSKNRARTELVLLFYVCPSATLLIENLNDSFAPLRLSPRDRLYLKHDAQASYPPTFSL